MRKQSNGDIILTQQELNEIKEDIVDETKFRTKVLIQLRLLQGIPGRVIRLEVWTVVLWVLTSGIVVTLINTR